MSDLAPQLILNRKWWWDPIDMEVFRHLGEGVQRQLIAISLQTQSEMLKVQAAGYDKIGAALSSHK